MTLDTATTAATRNDWPATLSALLVCWASAPAVDLADLIDRIDRLIPKPPYAGSGKRLRVAVLDDSSNQVHRIASMLPQLQRDEAEIVLRRASQHAPDPRWGTVMASWLQAPPFISGHALWKAVAVLIEHTADARLADIVQRPIREILPYELFGAMSGPWTRFGSIASTWPAGPTSGLDALSGLVESAEAAAEEQATLQSDLFERFVRDEADVGLPVLADLLQQAGDPRGELIALQCLPDPGSAETKRIAQILRDFGSAFCGPLAAFVLKRGRRFEKGYLHTATVRFKKPSQMEALGRCALGGTIRDIDLNGTVSWADVRSPWELGLPFLTGLRRARGVERPQGLFALLLHGDGDHGFPGRSAG